MKSLASRELKYMEKYLENQVETMKAIAASIEAINKNTGEIKMMMEKDRNSDRKFNKWLIGALLAAVIALAAKTVFP